VLLSVAVSGLLVETLLTLVSEFFDAFFDALFDALFDAFFDANSALRTRNASLTTGSKRSSDLISASIRLKDG
jgi:hypothetical protein